MVAQSGCLACHKIGENGNDGPGPELTEDRRRGCPQQAIARTLRQPDRADAVVPEPAGQRPEKFNAIVAFLSQLK